MAEADRRGPEDLIEQGRLLHRAGRVEEAERLYAQALAQDQDFAEAHQLMAVIAGQRGRVDEAIAGFRRSIALGGPTAERLYNLAEAYRIGGDFEAALGAYNQALTLDAGLLDAYRNAAETAKEMAAIAAARGDRNAVERINKVAAHYLVGLGHACLKGLDSDGAEAAYRASLALDPGQAEVCGNLGAIALHKSRPVEAETWYRRAHALEPRAAAYVSNLGLVLAQQARIDESASLLRQATEIDPSFLDAQINLRDHLLHPRHCRSDWSPAAMFEAHREWGRGAVARAANDAREMPPFSNFREPDRPLRIAYVGLDVGSDESDCFLEPLIARLDRSAFDVQVFRVPSEIGAGIERLKSLIGRQPYTLLPQRTKGYGQVIRRDRIDIAIDVAGHLPNGRLDIFALKPAPVCVAWLGYPDTTGLPTIDYRITDEVADPPGAEALYTERLYRLGQTSFIYRPREEMPAITALPAKTTGAVTFGNLDDLTKIAPEVLRVWNSILSRLPDARILLVAPSFVDPGYVDRFGADLAAAGIDPARVELRASSSDREHRLGAYSEIDIVLDTFPYNNSRARICEALWMGVPVIALWGDRPCARTSASVLAQIGLEGLVSETVDHYAAAAAELAVDLERLRALRAGMRERMRLSPLMDEAGFARRFGAALRDMWRQWCGSAA